MTEAWVISYQHKYSELMIIISARKGSFCAAWASEALSWWLWCFVSGYSLLWIFGARMVSWQAPATDLCPDADNTMAATSELGGNTPELQGKSEPWVVSPRPVPRPHQIFIAELVTRVSTSNTEDTNLDQNNEPFRSLVKAPEAFLPPVLIILSFWTKFDCLMFIECQWFTDSHIKFTDKAPWPGSSLSWSLRRLCPLVSTGDTSHHESLSPRHHRKLGVRRGGSRAWRWHSHKLHIYIQSGLWSPQIIAAPLFQYKSLHLEHFLSYI